MIKTSDDFLNAYPSPNAYLWDQNFVNGQYVVAYAFDYGLDQNVKSMLPKVIILVLGRNKIGDLQGVIENLPVTWPVLVKEDVRSFVTQVMSTITESVHQQN